LKRGSLYSRSKPKVKGEVLVVEKIEAKPKFKEAIRKYRVPLIAALPGLAALVVVLLQAGLGLSTRQTEITQEDIDAAVAQSLESVPIPSHSAKTYEAVRGSVVRVRAYNDGPDGGEIVTSTGSGVVILDKGVILTNIHVVQGAKRITVTFDTGMESDAAITGARLEDDLAVLQAAIIPDDLQAATLQSAASLQPGDFVTAVGFPFGIGPSVTSGVVSGLQREYRSPEGERVLTNLIQFDAAVNPGNSGGPLLNASGEVVGIVTGILNPTSQRVFVGIGFAVPIENASMAVGVPPF
jgi:S1-C subfamily serine protease